MPRFIFWRFVVNTKARNELIVMIVGLLLIVVGMGLFISKTSVTSDFIQMEGFWSWWKVLITFVPLVAGIVMLIVKPHLLVSKLLALVGAVALVVLIMVNTTIVVEDRITTLQWIICIGCPVVGTILCFVALFLRKRK